MSAGTIDRFAAARSVADAVLYEGYVLYPYRASSRKNQARWQFGVLTPKAFSEADGFERWSMRTECLVDPGAYPALAVRVRFLQVQHRAVESLDDGNFVATDMFEVDGARYVSWDEAVDQVVDLPTLALRPLDVAEYQEVFRFAGGTDTELIHSNNGGLAGRMVRQRQPIEGRVRVGVTEAGSTGPLLKVGITVENTSRWTGIATRRDEVMEHCLVAVHTMLAVEDGRFLSLLDPPPEAVAPAAACGNDGAFPVLIGGDDVVLASPIILYDHPEIAPESPGDLYDATEIDEILALRVLTLTDQEKAEARATDPRAAAIIDRCDDMSPQMWDRLHGTLRPLAPNHETPGGLEVGGPDPAAVPWWDPTADASVDPWSDTVTIDGVSVSKGAAVRLRPSHRSDAQDFFVDGLTATVAGVFKDVDGAQHVAVTVDDDPATEELMWQGRYLFFHPDEVEPLAPGDVL